MTAERWITAGRRLVAAVVVLAAGVVVVNGVRTSQAEVSASTSTAGLFSAGSIELDQVGDSVELLFNEDELYPGSVTDACVEVIYRGSIEADLRLHGRRLGGTELDRYIRFQVWTSDEPCPTEGPPPEPALDGTLTEMWQTHGSYADGLILGTEIEQGRRVTLAARAELLDDPDAEGRYTDFVLIVEARP
jgi:hypothetical protein